MATKLFARQFAFKVGAQERLTLEASLPFHRAYVAGDAETRAALRTEWCVGYIAGKESVSEARATKIWEAGKGAGALDAAACNRAASSFSTHVIRPEARNSANEGQARVRLPSGTIERIAAAYAGLTKAQIIEAHKRALASLSFE